VPHDSLLILYLITLPHFSVSSAISLPNSAGEPTSTVPPEVAKAALSSWVRRRRVDLLGQFVGDFSGRVLGRAYAV
jgi:hypothetical protein